jgi:ElaB/YqjD/DUF883 family membrane-anchored ribosome-binding protein
MDKQKSNDGNARDLGSEGSGSSMGKDIGSDISKGASEIHKSIDKTAGAAQPAVDRMTSSAHAGVDKMSGALTDASRRMDEKTRQLTDAYHHFTETGRDYVRSSPATSILVALAAGYTLSKLLSRRH